MINEATRPATSYVLGSPLNLLPPNNCTSCPFFISIDEGEKEEDPLGSCNLLGRVLEDVRPVCEWTDWQGEIEKELDVANEDVLLQRNRLPDTRRSVTHKVTIQDAQGDFDCYITVGLYDDGTPGELFVRVGKAGSTLNALLDSVGILTSFALQYGIPLSALCRKMRNQRFAPMGATSNKEIASCTSVIDYMFAWLEREYVKEDNLAAETSTDD